MPLLSSDILERQFGPTEVEILRQDDTTRIICTKTASGQILELSQVIFKQAGIAGFPDIHREVVAGKSIGKTFAAYGIAFERQVNAACKYGRALPDGFTKRFDTSGPATVVDVSILVGPDDAPYADILEVYSPEVSWKTGTGEVTEAIAARIRTFGELLTMSGN
jgi:hypothetical protein